MINCLVVLNPVSLQASTPTIMRPSSSIHALSPKQHSDLLILPPTRQLQELATTPWACCARVWSTHTYPNPYWCTLTPHPSQGSCLLSSNLVLYLDGQGRPDHIQGDEDTAVQVEDGEYVIMWISFLWHTYRILLYYSPPQVSIKSLWCPHRVHKDSTGTLWGLW